jgi:hypothetical protein
MTTEIRLSTIVDNSPNLTQLRPRRPGRRRTLELFFEADGSRGYRVRAWGTALAEDGGGAYAGTLELSPNDVFASVHELRDAWARAFIGYRHPGSGRNGYSFAEQLDLSREEFKTPIDTAMRALAIAGHKLFTALFTAGDAGLRELGAAVTAALRCTTDQVISIHSDDLFIPWWMLYLPSDDTTVLDEESARCSYTEFLGYRHHIEHNFKRAPGWESGLLVTGRVRAGVHVDRNLDIQFPTAPTIEPIIRTFHTYADVSLRSERHDLALAMSAADFGDQILYFGCHGTAGGTATTPDAHIALTDGQAIRASDFRYWLGARQFATTPIVYINACQGGQMSSMFYTSFSRELLARGANCLVGPQIDIPPTFAQWFADEFLCRLFQFETKIGDVVKDLTRLLIDRYANPLGLVMSVYRGMDTRLVSPDPILPD